MAFQVSPGVLVKEIDLTNVVPAVATVGVTVVPTSGFAIAAMACGTTSIKAVQKIAGPGNAFVVEAKRQLFGEVAIDLLPGPSEVLVIADGSANPAWAAADLLAQ